LRAKGVKTIYGEFKPKRKHCNIWGGNFWSREEKQTDVNIALFLLQMAIVGSYDKAIIISGDTDLFPAMKAVRSIFPGKEIGVVIPIGKASEDFRKQADFHYKMREHHLAKSQFPDALVLADKTVLNRPLNWH
jgi:uncharacterized LabA/DUF88 family protein